MKKDKLDFRKIIELIKFAGKLDATEFYFKSELLAVNIKFSTYANHKKIIDDKVVINNDFEKIDIKSKYVAKIKLKDENDDFFINVGDYIKQGDIIAKYEYLNNILELKSPCNGIVINILVNDHDLVDFNKKLITIFKI